MLTVFLCYAHEDGRMVKQFKKHLSSLEQNKTIVLYDDGDIGAGSEREPEINRRLAESQIILLLMSSSFLASNYCYKVGMEDAIERHEGKYARVIPVILRDVYWNVPPIDKLKALPDGEKAITNWSPRDKGFKNVVDGVRKVIEEWNVGKLPEPREERRMLIADLNRLIEIVKEQMLPVPRALATANTLHQLSIYIPNGVTLADLALGWEALSHSITQGEEPKVVARRVTCAELASMARFEGREVGSLEQAVTTWRTWVEAFQKRGDPRQEAMKETFVRELTELERIYQQGTGG